MKKTAIVSATAFLFLTISSLVAYLLRSSSFLDGWIPLALGLVMLGVSGIIAFIAKKIKWLNPVSFLISSVALGFSIRAWYLFRDLDNPVWRMLLISLGCAAYIWVYFFLSRVPPLARNLAVFTAVWLVASLVVYLLLVCLTTTPWVSTLGYYMLIGIAFIFAEYRDADSPIEFVRIITLSTFAVFGVIVIIAAIILSGDGCDADLSECCDCCDCCDLDVNGKGSAKKQKKS